MNQTIPVKGYACIKCSAPLYKLVLGGVGDWRGKIMCGECYQHWPVSEQELVKLISEQYGISEQAALLADRASQAEYESVCLGGSLHTDIPPHLATARWHARRLAVGGKM